MIKLMTDKLNFECHEDTSQRNNNNVYVEYTADPLAIS